MFLDQMRHFIAVARGEAEPACTLNEGVHALQLALAAQDSLRQGKMVMVK
jgi:predicted dehydrogenase